MILFSSKTYSAPFHGCTFLKERLIASSWPGGLNTGCAEFNVSPFACTTYKCTAFGCVPYPGAKVSGYLPDYIIEVTPFFGRSAFADVLAKDPDGVIMAAQLKAAVATWKIHFPSIPSPPGLAFENGHNETQEDNRQVYHKSLYGRMLPTPYEDVAWKIPGMDPPVGKSFVGAITGFAGISEFDPQTWNSGLADPDKKIATPLIPAANFACHGILSAAQGALQTAKQVIANLPTENFSPTSTGEVIALPVTPAAAAYGNLRPDSEALQFMQDPTRMCMGKLGPLLPRTGHTTVTDIYSASQMAAWRIASLTHDHFSAPFGTHAGGVRWDDKWQILWPPLIPTSTYCFAPGGLNTPPLTINPAFAALTRLPIRAGIDTLVIGVWRKRSKCVDIEDGLRAGEDIIAAYPIKIGLCQILNKTDLMP